MSLKILGVTVTNGPSASDHIRDIITNCAQTLCAMRVLRAHGLCDLALQSIYRSVIIAKLLYASSAWWGFPNASDRHRVDGFLRRSVCCGYCTPPDLPPFEDQCKAADRKLFDRIQSDVHHLLYSLHKLVTTASPQLNPKLRQPPEVGN